MSQPVERTLGTQLLDAARLLGAALRLAVTIRCLALGLVGLLATILGWRLVGLAFLSAEMDAEMASARAFHDVAISWRAGGDLGPFPISRDSSPIDPVFGVPYRLVEPFRRLFLVGRSWPTLGYYLSGGLWSLAVWAYCGAVISRVAVIRYGCGRTISVGEAEQFARRRWLAFFAAPALTLLGIALLAVPLFALGCLLRWDCGVFVAGLLWGAVLLVGVLMAVLGLGLMVGWPLMWGAISSEDADAFDAISRAYAYTFQSPVCFFVYALHAAVLGWAGWCLAWWFSEMVVQMSFWAVSTGGGSPRVQQLMQLVGTPSEEASALVGAGTGLMRLGVEGVRAAGSAFAFAFFWCVAAAIYLLLRRDTDHTPLDEIAGEVAASRRGTD